MNVEDVRQLAAGGESLTVEFKRATPRRALSDDEIIEAVTCLANGEGGTLLIGVEDDGTITGTAPRGRRGTQITAAQLVALVLNKTLDPLPVTVDRVDIDDVHVFVVHVPQAASPVCTSTGLYKRRTLRVDGSPQCVPYTPSLLISTARVLAERDYAGVPLPGISEDDLDPDEFTRFREAAATSSGDALLADSTDEDILRALRVRDHDRRLTTGALLLFGTAESIRHHLPTAETLLQVDDGGRLAVNHAAHEPLLLTAQRVFAEITGRNSYTEVTSGLLRIEVPHIPEMVARELIANALVHRDYSELGAVQVKLTATELAVSSPGGLPPGIRVDTMLDNSRPRSPILAEAFKRAGVVERVGRGVARVYDAMLRSGRPEPEYRESSDRSVVARARIDDADLGVVRFVAQWESEHQGALSLPALRVLWALHVIGVACTIDELVDTINPPARSLREDLAQLIRLGLVDTRGSGRGRQYHLAPVFYRLGEERSPSVRVRGVDTARFESMVTEFVHNHGSITRAQAADLCLITGDQASRLLRGMVTSGALQMLGERRWARYEAAN